MRRQRTSELRRLLTGDKIVLAPGAYDPLSARLVEQAGFPAVYITGAGVAINRLGVPDIGLTTMTEVLDTIPVEYAGRDLLLAAYQDFARAIVAHQGTGGMWHQLLDHPESYEETSCTGMFIYALARGVRRGWLDQGYISAVERGHAGLSRMISLTGGIDNICPGTPTQSSEEGYLERGPRRNDSHGIGPALLATDGAMTLREGVE